MTTFFIIRHATTEGIEHLKIQGSTDSPLSARGRQEAALTARVLKNHAINVCYCSPLGRACDTAEIICAPLGIKPIILDDLREFDFGWLEGQRYFKPPAMYSPFTERLKSLFKFILANMSGESLPRIRRRAAGVWDLIKRQNPANEILIVSHGVFINMLVQEIFKNLHVIKNKSFDVDACSITEIFFEDGKPHLIRLNDTTHLNELKSHDH